jgi:hypothetical protein
MNSGFLNLVEGIGVEGIVGIGKRYDIILCNAGSRVSDGRDNPLFFLNDQATSLFCNGSRIIGRLIINDNNFN